MTRGRAALVASCAIALTAGAVACASVIGADFGDYKQRPDDCNPLSPADKSRPTVFGPCTPPQQQCSIPTVGTAFRCGSAGAAPEGETCTFDTDCQPGLHCYAGDSFDFRCRPWCALAGGACEDDAGSCAEAGATSADGTQLGACVVPCDPEHPQSPTGSFIACVNGERCTLHVSSAVCDTAGSGAQGAGCDDSTSCKAGYGCVTPGGSDASVCQAYCRIGSKDCKAGTCTGYTAPHKLQGVEYGTCG